MNWKVKIANQVRKAMKRFPKKDARRLLFVLKILSENPYQGNIEKLEGEENTWRRRVGFYRIIYEIFSKEKIIWILDISKRTDTTYKRH